MSRDSRDVANPANPMALEVAACPPAGSAQRRRDPKLTMPRGRRAAILSSKRALDLALAIPAFLATAPILLVAAGLVRLASPGPVLFRQARVGLHEHPFMMLKLRTMHVGGSDEAFRVANTKELRGEAGPGSDGVYKLEDDPRVVPVARVLRRHSIDELPQLLNVIRGEMSLVGPRPSLPWEVELYTPEQRRRHDCPPGITGLWQVSGRNRLSMQQMLALDLEYVERRSLLLDLRILLRTPVVVLRGDDTR